jgi:hypothetical protein
MSSPMPSSAAAARDSVSSGAGNHDRWADLESPKDLRRLIREEENVIINGDAVNPIQGLMQLATAFTYTPAASDTHKSLVAHRLWWCTLQSLSGAVHNADRGRVLVLGLQNAAP